MSVKCEEEKPIEAAVEHDDEVDSNGETAGGRYKRDNAVSKDQQELEHLHGGKVPLPPEILLPSGSCQVDKSCIEFRRNLNLINFRQKCNILGLKTIKRPAAARK